MGRWRRSFELERSLSSVVLLSASAESDWLWSSASSTRELPPCHTRLGRCVADIAVVMRHLEADAMRCEALSTSLETTVGGNSDRKSPLHRRARVRLKKVAS